MGVKITQCAFNVILNIHLDALPLTCPIQFDLPSLI